MKHTAKCSKTYAVWAKACGVCIKAGTALLKARAARDETYSVWVKTDAVCVKKNKRGGT